MESQAYRELAAAQMFGHGLKFVPSIKWQKFMVWHIREEFEHYEAVAKMYREFTGEDVERVTNARLAQHPIPFAESWFELAMAQFLYDRGGFWQLKEYDGCSFVPYRRCIEKIIAEEKGHQAPASESWSSFRSGSLPIRSNATSRPGSGKACSLSDGPGARGTSMPSKPASRSATVAP
jgi:1,2-phenylacetyl-CoA epoxidase catalytic subunit